MMKAMKI